MVSIRTSYSSVLAVVLGALSVFFVLTATADGMRVSQRDAPSYMSSAENLAAGIGYQTSYGDPGKAVDFNSTGSLVVDFPPGYPALLSLFVMAGIPTLTGAKLLSAMLLAAITVVIFLFARRRGLGLLGATLAAAASMALSSPWALIPQSELAYGLLLLLVLIVAASSMRVDRPQLLWAAAFLAALATSVRTIGFALVGVVIVLALFSSGGWLRRIGMSVGVLALGVLPIIMFASGGSRELAWHPPGATAMKIAATAISSWLIPPLGNSFIRVSVFTILLVVLVVWVASASRYGGEESRALPYWLPAVLSAVAHLAIVLVVRTILDAQTNPNDRLIYPVALSLLVGGVELSSGLDRSRERGKRASLVLSTLAVLAIVAGVGLLVEKIGDRGSDQLSFTSDSFADSEGIAIAVGFLEGATTFSNIPDGLWYAGLAEVRPLPVIFDPLSLNPNERLVTEIAGVRAQVDSGGAVLYRRGHRPYMLSLDDVRDFAPCEVIDDGEVVILVGGQHPLCASS